ncbi:MAG: hypothetical protein HY658_13510 [Actinobacteria bacterium]|nr:hypothetical protein [Actinomycetota bacterium]
MSVTVDDEAEAPEYWPRVTGYDHRAIEEVLAGPTLFDQGVHLPGAIIEASLAATDPPILDRLRESGTPYVIDPQGPRFVAPTFHEVQSLLRIPYAPVGPLRPGMNVASWVRTALAFQSDLGAAAYFVPSLWVPDTEDGWAELNRDIHREAVRCNGTDVDAKALIAAVYPGWKSLKSPRSLLSPLADLPFEAVYVQPLRLRPTRDGVEKLVRYCRFLQEARDLGLRVIAGRLGAFGLLALSTGAGVFDSGLGEAESFDLAALNRSRSRARKGSGGGRDRRVYLPRLKTTLLNRDLEPILSEIELRSRFACTLPCHRHRGFEEFAAQRRHHYLRTRLDEVSALAALPAGGMRIERVHADLLEAQGHGRVVHRVLTARGISPPSFDHLDRWLAVLSRIAESQIAA